MKVLAGHASFIHLFLFSHYYTWYIIAKPISGAEIGLAFPYTSYKWRQRYGSLEVDELKKMKSLEEENETYRFRNTVVFFEKRESTRYTANYVGLTELFCPF